MELKKIKNQFLKANGLPNFDWSMPDITGQLVAKRSIRKDDYRLIKVTEISEDNAQAYRTAMSNVLSILNGSDASLIYILSGKPGGIDLYFGVVKREGASENIGDVLTLLQSSLKGNFLGSQTQYITTDSIEIDQLLQQNEHFGYAVGVPSLNEETKDDQEFQGIERLVNSLSGETWQLYIVAEPSREGDVDDLLDHIYNLSTELSIHIKDSYQFSENAGSSTTATKGDNFSNTDGTNDSNTRSTNRGVSETKGKSSGVNDEDFSKGKNSSRTINDGTSESLTKGNNHSTTKGTNSSLAQATNAGTTQAITKEKINKSIEEMQKHLSETLIERFRIGRSKGMFKTSIYFAAKNKQVYQRLTQSVKSIFQGNQSNVTPLRAVELPHFKPKSLGEIFQPLKFINPAILQDQRHSLLTHGVPFEAKNNTVMASSWLNTMELAILTSFPSKELPGIKLRKSVDFALNTAPVLDEKLYTLGHVVHHGSKLNTSPVQMPLKDLNKHVFVAGVTGAGKTTTCMKLLVDSNLPFLVIEPAKTEYRALYVQGMKDGFDVEYYPIGREDIFPFRLNPFELVHPKQSLMGHISVLTSTLVAVYPMEAAMPQIVEEAIIMAYKDRGWNVVSNWNYLYDDPFDKATAGEAWPTFSDLLSKLEEVIKLKGMGAEFEEKYKGSLVAKITNLTEGVKGSMLNTRHSIDFESLLEKRVVIELEELKGEQDKSILMGFIITRLAEAMKVKHAKDHEFQHLTLIEEAHRLLSRVEPGESESKKHGVEMFANLLAEVRKYGEGLIIADQSPMKLIPDVLKNTHTKIIHRLYEYQDRTAVANAMSMNEEQRDFLPNLKTGETVIYCGGWHAPIRVQVEETIKTDAEELSEAMLVEKGQQQMWQQLTHLSPGFAALAFIDEGNFKQHYSHAKRIIYLMLVFQKNVEPGQPFDKQNESVRSAALKLSSMIGQIDLSPSEIVLLLQTVFLDSLVIKPSNHKWLSIWIENFVHDAGKAEVDKALTYNQKTFFADLKNLSI